MRPHLLRLGVTLLVGAAALAVPGLATPASRVTAATPPMQIIGLAAGKLVRFSSATPGTIDATVTITGLLLGDVLHGIDVRPATGQLFGLAVTAAVPRTARLYVIDPMSGAATPIGAPEAYPGSGTRVALDFNPTVDRVRVVDSSDENLRLKPDTGLLAGNDTNLMPASANVGGIAYDRNTAARTSPPTTPTTLYAIRGNGTLAHIGGLNGIPSPNGGVLTQVGGLGVTPASNAIGFDISPANVGLASIKVGATENLYTINLATGAATLIGTIGSGTLGVTDITLVDAGVPTGASQYVGVDSYRLVDTRESGGKVAAGGVLTVPVTNRGEVPPAGVSAAVLNVTVTQPDAPGYTTVWPSTAPMGSTSSVNLDDTGQTRAALVTVPLGTDGAVKVFSERGSHVIVDVVGYFQPLRDNQGRLFPLTPSRLLDSRTGVGLPNDAPAKLGDAATIKLAVAGRGGVPATGATAAVVNLTMTGTDAGGYVTAYAGDVNRPLASNLNATSAGETIANLAIVPLGADGSINLFTERGTHLIVDVVGYFASNTGIVSPQGAFVPVNPDRILDTRTGQGAPQAGVVGPGWSINTTVAGFGGVPATGALAFAGTVTATGSLAGGYVTVYPTSNELPTASTLNTTHGGQTIANSVILGLGTQGQITLFSETGTHLITDVTGYFMT